MNQLFEIDTTIKPPLKWVGGKTQIIKQLEYLIDIYLKKINYKKQIYHEPFIGGGALFFNVWFRDLFNKYFISDINKSLINFYLVIQNSKYSNSFSKFLIEVEKLQHLINSQDTLEKKSKVYLNWVNEYNSLKIQKNKSVKKTISEASLFLALNKTCFNGMYRENQKGLFNVPFNKGMKNTKMFDEKNLLSVKNALSSSVISNKSFEKSINFINIKKNHLVFIDPPYLPISQTANFSDYSSEGFKINDHLLLAEKITQIDEKGAFFILTNSNLLLTKEIYNNDKKYTNLEVDVSRSINSSSSKRKTGITSEIIITNIRED